MVVWVEAAVLDDASLLKDKKFQKIKDKLVTFKYVYLQRKQLNAIKMLFSYKMSANNYIFSISRDGRDDLTDRIDFIVCLGGDGTLLYASLLFQQSVPPVMAFHLGSLGFLTPFQFDNFQEQVTNVLEGNAALTLRSRLRCIIVRKNQEQKSISDESWTPKTPTEINSTKQKAAANILVSIIYILLTDDWKRFQFNHSCEI